MRYFASLAALFQHPSWGMQLLFTSICLFIPILGPIVLLGYYAHVFVYQHRTRQAVYPAFDFDRFTAYLSTGVWPFLVGLVLGLIMLPVFGVAAAPLIAIPALELRGAEVLAPIGAAVLLYVIALLGLMVVTVPLYLRAVLMQRFGEAFSWTFIKGFVARVWGATLLAHLFIGSAGLVLVIIGYLFCIIGAYPAIAIVMFAQWQLHRQLYELYLARGGAPLPIADKLTASVPPL